MPSVANGTGELAIKRVGTAQPGDMPLESDWVRVHRAIREGVIYTDGRCRISVPITSTKPLLMRGMESWDLPEADPDMTRKKAGRVWVIIERMETGRAPARARQAEAPGMASKPSLGSMAGGAGDASAAVDGSAPRIYRITTVDPHGDLRWEMRVTTGRPTGDRDGAADSVKSLRGLVPEIYLRPEAEAALATHLTEERVAHDGPIGDKTKNRDRIKIREAIVRQLGLGAASGLPDVLAQAVAQYGSGLITTEFAIEARLAGEAVTLRLVNPPEGVDIRGVLGHCERPPVPIVIPFEQACAAAGWPFEPRSNLRPLLLAVASRVALVQASEGGRMTLHVVPVASPSASSSSKKA